MKKQALIAATLFAIAGLPVFAQNDNAKGTEITVVKKDIQKLEQSVETLKDRQRSTDANIETLKDNVESLMSSTKLLSSKSDSLQRQISDLKEISADDRATFTQDIKETRGNLNSAKDTIESRTLWAIVIIAVLLAIIAIVAIVVGLMGNRVKKGATSIDEVRSAQDALKKAHIKLQEESVAIDNKLAEILTKQLESKKEEQPETSTSGEIDHSLALKVADEIVRIETNLSRMDTSIRGYRQLSRAVQRIKDNFAANGYEIVDMLNKPYISGMKTGSTTFVLDENLEHGKQIITKVIKPQINYNQKMIQAAEIEVSQSE